MKERLFVSKSERMTDFLATFERALVVCAHTDDEFASAGTIYRLTQANVDVLYIALSRCEASVPSGFPLDILEKECRECTSRLGIRQDRVEIWDFEVRRFPEKRQDILERLVRVNREFRPDLVLMPSSTDTHQDHSTVFHEGFRAFKLCWILGYEFPQNLVSFENSAFVRLSAEVLQRKIEALSAYKSQMPKLYSRSAFIEGLATVRGAQCGEHYAEGFEAIRVVI